MRARRVLLLALWLGSLAIAPWPGAPPALAVGIAVATTADAPKLAGSGANCQSTLPGGLCTLRAAVQTHNFLGGTNNITLGLTGSYTLTVQGAFEEQSLTGDLDVTVGNLTISNTSGGTVTVDALGNDRVFDVGPLSVQPVQLNLAGVTVRGGNSRSEKGGGIRVNPGATLQLTNAIVSDNTAGSFGGGVGCYAATCTLTNVVVDNNVAVGLGGGIAQEYGTLTMSGGTISNNRRPAPPSTAVLEGGGLGKEFGEATLTDVNIATNSGTDGGGIFNVDSLSLQRVTLQGNAATGNGGGVYSASNLSTTLALTNVTVSGNNATGQGGGLFKVGPQLAQVTNATIANNTASTGRAFAAQGAGANTFLNTILVSTPTGSNCVATFTQGGNNLSNDASCTFAGPGNLTNSNPQLGPLAFNGGTTPTHALPLGSPAVNTGANAGCPGTDQRGVIRPQAAICDVGAYELQFGGTATPTVSPTATLSPTPAATPVACGPVRPNILVSSASVGSGRVRVSARTTLLPGTSLNRLDMLQFRPNENMNTIQFVTPVSISTLTSTIIVTPNTPTPEIVFDVLSSPGVGRTVFFTAFDPCGGWPTFGGGGPTAFGSGDSGTPVPDAATPRPTPGGPGAVATPTTVAQCTPRPAVRVTTAGDGAGALRVTVGASDAGGVRLLALRFGTASGATVEATGQSGPGDFVVALPPGRREASFVVRRAVPGQSATVPLVVVDSCGEWPTVVGGGASAF